MTPWHEAWPLVHAIPGWLSEAQAAILWKLAGEARVVVELGAWKGRSTAALALGVPSRSQVWSIDTFHGSADERLPGCPQAEVLGVPGGTLSVCAHNLDRLGLLGDPVRMVVADHVEAACTMALQVDLLFIDGEHTTAATVAAFRAWEPRLAPGSVVVFHDLQMASVRDAVHHELQLPVEDVSLMAIWRSGSQAKAVKGAAR